MPNKLLVKLLALLCVFGVIAAACGDDDDSSADGGTEETTTVAPEGDDGTAETTTVPAEDGATETTEAEGGADEVAIWDDGPCDESLDPVKVGLITVFETGVLTLIDQAQALDASVDAFNARGGVNGHCYESHTCDDGADPNQALQCANDLIDEGIVATINDTTSFGAAEVTAAFAAAGVPRFAVSPGQPELADPNSYPFDAGGLGTSMFMPYPLIQQGVTKIAIVRVDAAAATALKPIMEGIYGDEGVTFVSDLPVPAGTTDYSQFILQAQNDGAEGIVLPLGGQETIQVLEAAKSLDADLLFSTSLGTLPWQDMADLGDYAARITLNAAIPPATADLPVMDLISEELGATGIEALQRPNMKSSPMRSWVGLYALTAILRDAGVEEFTPETVTAAIKAAQDIDMLGITPPFTPDKGSEGAFSRISNGAYQFWGWNPDLEFDGTAGNFELVYEADWAEVACESAVGPPTC